jgi:hypothetical protein
MQIEKNTGTFANNILLTQWSTCATQSDSVPNENSVISTYLSVLTIYEKNVF